MAETAPAPSAQLTISPSVGLRCPCVSVPSNTPEKSICIPVSGATEPASTATPRYMSGNLG
eukprot:5375949-Prymnesium_polylepis.2